MDDFDIYINVDAPVSRECQSQGPGHVYEDFNQDMKTRNAAFPGNEHKTTENCVAHVCYS